MFYTPHILQRKVAVTEQTNDDLGMPIFGTSEWITLCACRCDDSGVNGIISDNGQMYRYSYHVVYESDTDVKAGDDIQCIDEVGNVRGAGKVIKDSKCNCLGYKEVYI